MVILLRVNHNMQRPHLLALKNCRMRLHIVRTYCAPASKRPEASAPLEVAKNLLHRLSEAGKVLGRSSQQRMSAAARSWWDKYEEFVGLNEVREAQGNVTEVMRIKSERLDKMNTGSCLFVSLRLRVGNG